MARWLQVVGILMLVLAILVGYIQSTLKYSLVFYIPGYFGKMLIKTAPYEEIVWKESSLHLYRSCSSSSSDSGFACPTTRVQEVVVARQESLNADGTDGRTVGVKQPTDKNNNKPTKFSSKYKTETAESKPNIILIIADDLGINDLYGGVGVDTPNIARLRDRGVTLTSAYAGHATCSPSRAAIMTGRSGARFGFELTAIPTIMARFIGTSSVQAKAQVIDAKSHPHNNSLTTSTVESVSDTDTRIYPTPIFNAQYLPQMPPYTDMVLPLSEVLLSDLLVDLGSEEEGEGDNGKGDRVATRVAISPAARLLRSRGIVAHPSHNNNTNSGGHVQSGIAGTGGYDTAYIGKWHLGESVGARPHDRGYQESLAFLKGASLYAPRNDPDVFTLAVGDVQDDFLLYNLGNYIHLNDETRFKAPYYMTDYLADEAVKVVNTKTEAPFFLTVAFNAPHTPLQAKRSDFDSPLLSHISNEKQRVYASMIKALDDGIGKILNAVELSKNADNTLIVFTSDNGAPYYVGLGNNKPYRGGKYNFFEGGLRVPFLFSWPAGNITPQSMYTATTSHMDIFTTLAAAAGVDVESLAREKIYDGVNLLPYITGVDNKDDSIDITSNINSQSGSTTSSTTSTGHTSSATTVATVATVATVHDSLFWRSGQYVSMLSLITNKTTSPSTTNTSTPTIAKYKLSVSEHPDRMFLYDLCIDPTEQHTLISKHLPWSTVRDTVTACTLGEIRRRPEGLVQCRRLLCAHVQADHTTSPANMEENSCAHAELYCELVEKLCEMNNEQPKALWPPLIEAPIGIDDAGPEQHFSTDRDYVYWAN